MKFARVASLVFNQPLLIEPRALESIAGYLATRMLGKEAETNLAAQKQTKNESRAAYQGLTQRITHSGGAYELTSEGIAIIPLVGELTHRADWMDALSGLVGYEELEAQHDHAQDNPAVQGILWDAESHGGTVPGCFTLADKLFNARGLKPAWTLVNECAYSAAYALASATSRILMPDTAGVGSVGVIWLAREQIEKNKAEGVRYVAINYGERKKDFYPEFKIPSEALAWAQEEVNRVGEKFVGMVARNRGLEPEAVRATQAGLLFGQAAVDAGFADAIISAPGPGETLATKAAAMLAAEIQKQNQKGGYGLGMAAAQENQPKQGDSVMSDEKTPEAQASQAQAQPESAATAPDPQALASAKAEGGQEAKARIKAITGCEEAKGREALANHFAFETDMDAEAAKAALAAAPKAEAGAGKHPLAQAMDNYPDADVGPGAPDNQASGADLMPAAMARHLERFAGQQKGGA